MMRRFGLLARRLAGDERGFVVVYVAIALPVLFGVTALSIDYGYVLYVQHRLQATTDQAALAGAQGLSDETYTAKANLYSSSAAAGGINTIPGITVPSVTAPRVTVPKIEASTTSIP